MLSGVDWLPTLCQLAGATIPDADFDGENVADIWQGKDRERTKPLFWKLNNVRSDMVIRLGQWKLFEPGKKKGELLLYDLSRDPAEQQNLADKHPEVVKKLRSLLADWNARLPKEYTKSEDKD